MTQDYRQLAAARDGRRPALWIPASQDGNGAGDDGPALMKYFIRAEPVVPSPSGVPKRAGGAA